MLPTLRKFQKQLLYCNILGAFTWDSIKSMNEKKRPTLKHQIAVVQCDLRSTTSLYHEAGWFKMH